VSPKIFKRSLFLFAILLAPCVVLAKQDSLINLIKIQKDDTSRVDLQLKLAGYWIDSKQFDRADSLLEEILPVATDLQHQKGLAN